MAGTRPEHITATLVDLAVRGHLVIEVVDDSDWQLTRQSAGHDRVVPYEKRLLAAVFGRAATARLGQLPKSAGKGIGRVHALLIRDLLRQGALQPGRASADAEDVQRMRAFRDRLRAAPEAVRAQERYVPYAIAFGLGPQWAEHVAGADTGWLRCAPTMNGAVADTGWLNYALALPWAAYPHGGGTDHSHAGGYGGFESGHHGGHHHSGW